MIAGYLFGLALFSAVSALFVKMAVRFIAHARVKFAAAFVISFISFLAAFLVQDISGGLKSQDSFVQVLPAFIFFFSCWLLSAQFISFGETKSNVYGKAFLVTLVQCFALFIFLIIFSLFFVTALIAALSIFK